MPRQGKRRKKTRTHVDSAAGEKEALGQDPRSFVLKRGHVGPSVADLVLDFRKVMQPLTGMKLKESPKTRIKDYVQVAGHFGVTHLLAFSSTEAGTYLKLARLPQGPTVTFRVREFALARDVVAAQKRPARAADAFAQPAVVVLGGFKGGDLPADVAELVAALVKGAWPSLDPRTFAARSAKRVALWVRDPATGVVQFRHYAVLQRQGVSRPVRKLLQSHKVPDLSQAAEMASWLDAGGAASDSEADDDVPVQVPAKRGRDARSEGTAQVTLHLKELGPRVELELLKVEAGICDGEVLHHAEQTKTPEEAAALSAKKAAQAALGEAKAARRAAEEARKEALRARREEKLAQQLPEEDEAPAPARRKKFHPLYGKKKKEKAVPGTVEFEGGSGKARRNRAGGWRKDRRGEDFRRERAEKLGRPGVQKKIRKGG